jgi:hypothetical protein
MERISGLENWLDARFDSDHVKIVRLVSMMSAIFD